MVVGMNIGILLLACIGTPFGLMWNHKRRTRRRTAKRTRHSSVWADRNMGDPHRNTLSRSWSV